MTKATGKRLANFLKSPEIKEYLQALSKKCNLFVDKNTFKLSNRDNEGIKDNFGSTFFLVEIVQTGKTRHTYFHPKLALRFAQWCSAEFAVEVDFWLDFW